MKIIKQGDPKWNLHLKTFECRICGCVFEAKDDEYIVGPMYRNSQIYSSRCPFCKNEVYLEE